MKLPGCGSFTQMSHTEETQHRLHPASQLEPQHQPDICYVTEDVATKQGHSGRTQGHSKGHYSGRVSSNILPYLMGNSGGDSARSFRILGDAKPKKLELPKSAVLSMPSLFTISCVGYHCSPDFSLVEAEARAAFMSPTHECFWSTDPLLPPQLKVKGPAGI